MAPYAYNRYNQSCFNRLTRRTSRKYLRTHRFFPPHRLNVFFWRTHPLYSQIVLVWVQQCSCHQSIEIFCDKKSHSRRSAKLSKQNKCKSPSSRETSEIGGTTLTTDVERWFISRDFISIRTIPYQSRDGSYFWILLNAFQGFVSKLILTRFWSGHQFFKPFFWSCEIFLS